MPTERRPKKKVGDGTLAGGLSAATGTPVPEPTPSTDAKGGAKTGGKGAKAEPARKTTAKGGVPVDSVTGPTGDRRERAPRAPEFKVGTEIENVSPRYNPAHPGEYQAEVRYGKNTLFLRIVTDNAHYIPASNKAPITVHLLEVPTFRGNEAVARAVVDGASADLDAMKRIEKVKPAILRGEHIGLDGRALTQLEPGVFAVSRDEDDGRTMRVRSLLGWNPETVDAGGQRIVTDEAQKGMDFAVINGGEDTFMYEALPAPESNLLTEHVRLVNMLKRYQAVLKELANPEGFHDHTEQIFEWNKTDDKNSEWITGLRKAIAQVIRDALNIDAHCIKEIQEGKKAGIGTLHEAVDGLEDKLYEIAFYIQGDAFPKEKNLSVSELKKSQVETFKNIRGLLVSALGEKEVHSEDQISTIVGTLDTAVAQLPDSFLNRANRGGVFIADLNRKLIEAGVAPILKDKQFVVKGRIDTSSGTPKAQDLSESLKVGLVLDDIMAGDSEILFDSPQARAERAVTIARARRDNALFQESMLPRNITVNVDAFIAALKAGEIEMRDVQAVTNVERVMEQLRAADIQEVILYFNGHPKLPFPIPFAQLRAAHDGNYRQVVDVITGRVLAGLRALPFPFPIEKIELDKQDLDPNTIEIKATVLGVECPISISGNPTKDRGVFQPFLPKIEAAKAAKEKREADAGKAELYAWLEKASLQRVVEYMQGEVLGAGTKVPEQYHSYRSVLRNAEVATAVRERILARVRTAAGLPDAVAIVPVSNDPFIVEVTFGEKKTERMTITGVNAKDGAEFQRVRDAVVAEENRIAADGGATAAETRVVQFLGFLQTGSFADVVRYVRGASIKDATLPDALKTFHDAQEVPGTGERVIAAVLARVRTEARLPAEGQLPLRIVGTNPFVVEASLVAGRTERMTVTGVAATDAPEFRRVREMCETELGSPALLERLNNNYRAQLGYPLRLNEVIVIGGVKHRLTAVENQFDGMFVRLSPEQPGAAGLSAPVRASDFVFEVAQRRYRREILQADDAYVDRLNGILSTAELIGHPEQAFAMSGIPSIELGGKILYRFRLGIDEHQSGAEQGATYRVLRIDQSRSAVILAQETPNGNLVVPVAELEIDIEEMANNPQWFEMPDNGVYVRLAQALHLATPELVAELFRPGMLQYTEVHPEVTDAAGNVTRAEQRITRAFTLLSVAASGQIQHRFQGSGEVRMMSADDFIAAATAGNIAISESQRERYEQRSTAVVPVIEHPMLLGNSAEYRFYQAIRRFRGYEQALHEGGLELREQIGDDMQTARITLIEENSSGIVVEYDPAINHSPARLTYEAVIASILNGRFAIAYEEEDTDESFRIPLSPAPTRVLPPPPLPPLRVDVTPPPPLWSEPEPEEPSPLLPEVRSESPIDWRGALFVKNTENAMIADAYDAAIKKAWFWNRFGALSEEERRPMGTNSIPEDPDEAEELWSALDDANRIMVRTLRKLGNNSWSEETLRPNPRTRSSS